MQKNAWATTYNSKRRYKAKITESNQVLPVKFKWSPLDYNSLENICTCRKLWSKNKFDHKNNTESNEGIIEAYNIPGVSTVSESGPDSSPT